MDPDPAMLRLLLQGQCLSPCALLHPHRVLRDVRHTPGIV